MNILTFIAALVAICQGLVYLITVLYDYGLYGRIKKRLSKKNGGPRF
jgi:hypothetical protein